MVLLLLSGSEESLLSSSVLFEYVAEPVVSYITPSAGIHTESTMISVVGEKFALDCIQCTENQSRDGTSRAGSEPDIDTLQCPSIAGKGTCDSCIGGHAQRSGIQFIRSTLQIPRAGPLAWAGTRGRTWEGLVAGCCSGQ